MILSISQASALENYDLSLLTEAEQSHIRNAKTSLLQSCRAHICFEFRKMVGIQTAEAAVLRDAKGRPYFANLNYDISISHKDQQCWLGLTKKPGVIGVDIEKLVEPEAADLMFKHIANDSEKDHYHNLSSHLSKEEYLTILWSLKECWYKCDSEDQADRTVLIDPFEESAQINFREGSRLAQCWQGRQIQIKYSIQKPYIYSHIYASAEPSRDFK